MKKMFFLTSAVLSALVACASADSTDSNADAVPARLAKFERTGEYVSCLRMPSIKQIYALDERYFLFRTGVNRYYLNITSSGCADADSSFNRLQYTTPQTRLCENELIKVVDGASGDTVSSCTLGDFEKLKSKASAAE